MGEKRTQWALLGCLIAGSAAWVVQLSGVASLQASCHGLAPQLADTRLEDLTAYLQTAGDLAKAQVETAKLGLAGMMTFVPLLLRTEEALIRATSALAARSATSLAPAFTPDDSCADFYRYLWAAAALQAATLALLWWGVATRRVHRVIVSGCTFLAMSSIMAIQLAHTLFHLRNSSGLPDHMLTRGMVCFAGAVGVVSANCGAILALSAWDMGGSLATSYSGSLLPTPSPTASSNSADCMVTRGARAKANAPMGPSPSVGADHA